MRGLSQTGELLETAVLRSKQSGQSDLSNVSADESWSLRFENLIWVSDWETWRNLAASGIWVNGSAEGLGEQEDPRITTLHGKSPEWSNSGIGR